MKTIGLLGGMSWESTAEYYQHINRGIHEKMGHLHSAKCLIHSFNFQEIADLQQAGNWQEALHRMTAAARGLETAGADCIVLCTNTMHTLAEEIDRQLNIPFLHIVDATAVQVKQQDLTKVAVLGTKYTMMLGFYQDRLYTYGIEAVIPDETDRNRIHDIIYNELCQGILREKSRNYFLAVVEKLSHSGAEGVILACTEIPLLLKQKDTAVPLFNTTKIHADAAVAFALEDNSLSEK